MTTAANHASPARLGRAQLWVATGLGAGYAPVAPGTAGSAVGVLLFWGLAAAGGWPAVAAGLAAATIAGLWSARGAEAHFGRSDPGPVVIDEIAGQLLTLLFFEPTMRTMVAGFFVFRVLDVVKPFPARRAERLAGAVGILADDLVAGVYANLVLHAIHWLAPWPG